MTAVVDQGTGAAGGADAGQGQGLGDRHARADRIERERERGAGPNRGAGIDAAQRLRMTRHQRARVDDGRTVVGVGGRQRQGSPGQGEATGAAADDTADLAVGSRQRQATRAEVDGPTASEAARADVRSLQRHPTFVADGGRARSGTGIGQAQGGTRPHGRHTLVTVGRAQAQFACPHGAQPGRPGQCTIQSAARGRVDEEVGTGQLQGGRRCDRGGRAQFDAGQGHGRHEPDLDRAGRRITDAHTGEAIADPGPLLGVEGEIACSTCQTDASARAAGRDRQHPGARDFSAHGDLIGDDGQVVAACRDRRPAGPGAGAQCQRSSQRQRAVVGLCVRGADIATERGRTAYPQVLGRHAAERLEPGGVDTAQPGGRCDELWPAAGQGQVLARTRHRAGAQRARAGGQGEIGSQRRALVALIAGGRDVATKGGRAADSHARGADRAVGGEV